MENDTQTLVERRLQELPEDVRKAIEDANLGEHVQDIGADNHLHIDQIGKLEDETLLVMLGFTSVEDFPERIRAELNIAAEDAGIIAANINSEIFLPIRASMQKFMEERAKSAGEKTNHVEAPQPKETPLGNNVPTPAAIASAPAAPPPSSATVLQGKIEADKPKAPGLADRMFSEPTSSVPKTVDLGAPNASAPAMPPPAKKYEIDPYREPVD